VLGEGSGFFEFAPAFLKAAEHKKMKIRKHVTLPGMIKMWSRLGVIVGEFVFMN